MSITKSTEKSVEQVIAMAAGATFTFAKPPVFGGRSIRHHSRSSYQNHLFFISIPSLSPILNITTSLPYTKILNLKIFPQ